MGFSKVQYRDHITWLVNTRTGIWGAWVLRPFNLSVHTLNLLWTLLRMSPHPSFYFPTRAYWGKAFTFLFTPRLSPPPSEQEWAVGLQRGWQALAEVYQMVPKARISTPLSSFPTSTRQGALLHFLGPISASYQVELSPENPASFFSQKTFYFEII